MILIGTEKVKKQLDARIKAAGKGVAASVKAAALDARRAAKATKLFDDKTGNLRQQIKMKSLTRVVGLYKYKVGPDPKTAFYGRLVETGHVMSGKFAKLGGRVKGRGFMEAAFNSIVTKANTDIRKAMQAAIK